jgi:cysteine synthase A
VVKLRRVSEAGAAEIFLKLEQFNPSGSFNDRPAIAMVEQAMSDGLLQTGGTLIEATCGNMGIGLAMICAVKGLHLILTMPESISLEQRLVLQAYGARLELTPAHLRMAGAIARAKELLAATPGALFLRQYENRENVEAHAKTTGSELVQTIRAEGGQIDAFLMGVGTGGTISGVGRALKQAFPDVLVLAVQPRQGPALSGVEGPALSGVEGAHRIPGIGVGFKPELLDNSVVDRAITVDDRSAWKMAQRLAREEGILAGISTGAHVEAALHIARQLGAERRVFTLCCDSGDRYFSLGERFS